MVQCENLRKSSCISDDSSVVYTCCELTWKQGLSDDLTDDLWSYVEEYIYIRLYTMDAQTQNVDFPSAN